MTSDDGAHACPSTTPPPGDRDTLEHIHRLVDEEHRLRDRLLQREINPSDEQERLRAIEAELDQCWDLLRQRRALRRIGGNPDAAGVRPVEEVERYLS